MTPNERRATLNGFILGAALWDMPFLRPAALFLADVQQAHDARNALQVHKNGFIATTRINVNKPLACTRNSGAGKSEVLTLLAAFASGMKAEDALIQGVACGSATATHPGTQLFHRDELRRLTARIEVRRMHV